MQVLRRLTQIIAPLIATGALAVVAPMASHADEPVTFDYRLHELLELATRGDPRVTADGSPKVEMAEPGPVLAFDGATDRLVLDENPLAGAREFTIEVLFRPRDAFPSSPEPRFLHIESATNPKRRLTMELRLDDQHQWYLDAFLMSEEGRQTLIDSGLVHPVGRWHHAAITYRDGHFATWVNGRKELEAEVRYLPIPADARMSIGARLNRVHWFAGEIAALRVTHAALEPERFALLQRRPG